MTYTSGPWDLFNNVHPIRGDAMTPEEIGQLIADRVRKTREEGGGSDKFLFVDSWAGRTDDLRPWERAEWDGKRAVDYRRAGHETRA